LASIKKNIVSNFILTSSSLLLPLITFPYVTRILSNENIGAIFFVDAFTSYFLLFASLGIPSYGVREISKLKEDPSKTSKLLVELVTIQLSLSLILSLIYLIFPYFLPSLRAHYSLVEIGCINVIASSFLIEWFYQGTENFGYIAKRSIAFKVLFVLLLFVFVRKSSDFVLYYLLTTLLVVFNALLNFAYFLKKSFRPFREKLEIKKHLKPLVILLSINLSISVYTILDTIILGFFTDPVNVSLYNVPLRLVKIFWTVVGSVGIVLIPRIANLYQSDNQHEVHKLMTKSISIVFLLTIPFFFFCQIFPEEIITLISGPKYIHAANALRILSVLPLIIALCNIFGTQFLMAIGSDKKILVASIFGLVASLTLNFLLVPGFKFIGSSIASVTAEGCVCLYLYFQAVKKIKIILDKALLVHILSSSLFCLVLIFLLPGSINGICRLFIAAVAYLSAFALLQFFYYKNEFIFSLIYFKALRNGRSRSIDLI
jgi:O-antigen/teichoic acid export membrane protein